MARPPVRARGLGYSGTVKSVRIGLLGVGTVGAAVARAIATRGDVLARASRAALVVQRAAVRDPAKERGVSLQRVTTDRREVVRADDVDVVVELLGGEEPAFALIKEAIERGKPVVTANKRVVSWHGPELHDLAARKGVELRYEAAVGGGIPLLAPLADDLAANRIVELRAIINGTTNYILTQMAHGASFQDALATAQKLGYAETDPGDDVDAVDAAAKLAILVPIAFGVSCTPREIFREGVRSLDPVDIAYGRELGYALKILASARSANGGIEARVHPAFLSVDHPLARVDGARNAVHLLGDLCGPVMFSGLGAGGGAPPRGAPARPPPRPPRPACSPISPTSPGGSLSETRSSLRARDTTGSPSSPWTRSMAAATCAFPSTTCPACSLRSPTCSRRRASGSRASSSASRCPGKRMWC